MEQLHKPFESLRLTFRPLAEGDENILFQHIDDVLTQHWIGWEKLETLESYKQSMHEKHIQIPEKEVHFLAFSKDTGGFIGMCGIEPDMLSPEAKELNVWVARESQGKGYGTEMVQNLVRHAAHNTKLKYLIYSVTHGNIGSQAIADKLKLTPYRTFTALKRGIQRDVTDYKLYV